MPKLIHQQRTHPLVWLVAIVCAFLAVAVIITGILVIAIYIIYQPTLPYIKVPYAHLNKLDFDQSGLLDVEIAIAIVAENDNARVHVSFSDFDVVLKFQAIEIAELATDPFEVEKNSSVVFKFVVRSSPIPLDEGAMTAMDASLRQDKVALLVDGEAKMQWRVGVFASVKLWTHLSCQIDFSYANGSSLGLDCTSKSH